MSDKTTSRMAGFPADNSQDAGESVVISKEGLTAFERWELPSFDAFPANKPPPGSRKNAQLTVGELENLRLQTHNEGFTQGRNAGYAAGIKQARDEATQLHALMQNLQTALNQFDEQMTQSLLDLSLEVAHQMVRETLQAKPEVILKIVSDAISALPHFNQNAHLTLHPDDAELVRKQMGEQLSHTGWKIFTDAQIRRGGCRVETSHSQVDATVEARWRRIVEAIGQDKSWQP
ncbi:MAG: flagellar assembly protein FliH [Gallionellaceae bacterium]|nr:flagellar assembly protein FliH [Gallionellaceae bacterium]